MVRPGYNRIAAKRWSATRPYQIIAIAVIFLILWLLNGIGMLSPLNTPIRVR